METLTIVLSALLGLLSPVGTVGDRLAEKTLRRQLVSAESLRVRIDNPPTHQILRGKIAKVWIAGRGIVLQEGLRIAEIDLETDPIDVDFQRLASGKAKDPRTTLDKPLQAGIRLVLTEADLNQGLRSPLVADRLKQLSIQALRLSSAEALDRYEFQIPQVDLLENQRLRFRVNLQAQASPEDKLTITGETGLAIAQGHQVQFINPQISVEDVAVPPEILDPLITGLQKQLDLVQLEPEGITGRILQWQITDNAVQVAVFVRIENPNPLTKP
jgi:hypothetical protein